MFFLFISFTNIYLNAYLHVIILIVDNRIFLKLLGVGKVDKKQFTVRFEELKLMYVALDLLIARNKALIFPALMNSIFKSDCEEIKRKKELTNIHVFQQ
jgi:hypothetical protein